eukprot:1183693-Prorocentrum_minimum.AAC.2
MAENLTLHENVTGVFGEAYAHDLDPKAMLIDGVSGQSRVPTRRIFRSRRQNMLATSAEYSTRRRAAGGVAGHVQRLRAQFGGGRR